MDRRAFAVLPDAYGEPRNVFGDKIFVLAPLEATNHAAMTMVQGRAGNGPPPHHHPWDETFFVFRGSVEYVLDGEKLVAGPGTLVHFPAGTVHSFRFVPGGTEILEITGQGSRAIDMFAALDRGIGGDTSDHAKIARVLKENGVTVVE